MFYIYKMAYCATTKRCFVIPLTEDVQFFTIKMEEDRIAMVKTFLAGVLRCQATMAEVAICRSFADEIMLR